MAEIVYNDKDTSNFEKCKTGITGLDELTRGGLPKNRITLIAGGPGCGKTVMAMEFLVKGATEYNEPGVFFSFEENLDNLHKNFQSMNYDLKNYIKHNTIDIEHVNVVQSEIIESGDFSLEPLFLRLEHAIQKTNAKRVVIDTIETIFSAISNSRRLRSEINRLFNWLQEKNVTTIVTGEQGAQTFTRQGLEEYVSDCVILLDHRIMDQVSKRRLRIIKYRGSSHISDECPFLISAEGIIVIPVISLKLDHPAPAGRISSGIPDLDKMMDNQGYFQGSSVLVSGTSGTGKSSLAAKFLDASCRGGKKCLYFSFEESVQQINRNMNSIGIDLDKWLQQNLLTIKSERTSTLGLEEHLLKIIQTVNQSRPDVLIMDPITNFFAVGQMLEIKIMLTRLIDYLKARNVTGLFTSLTNPDGHSEQTNIGISSIMDTWIILRDYHHKNTKRRLFYLLKARGMKHSQEIKEMVMDDTGIQLIQPEFNIDSADIFSG